MAGVGCIVFLFSSRRRHTRFKCDWSSDVCSSDLKSPFRVVAWGKLAGSHTENIALTRCTQPGMAVLLRPPKPSYGLLTRDREHDSNKKHGSKGSNKKHGSKDPPRQEKSLNMKNKKLNAVHVWKQLEDLAVPRLHLSGFDRAVYSHLLRHSRLEGKPQLRFSILSLARGLCPSSATAREAVRTFAATGGLPHAAPRQPGHLCQECLPLQKPSPRARPISARASLRLP